MFTSCMNKGFQIKFENGYTISVQWGHMNYCAVRNCYVEYNATMETDIHESKTAEIAVFNPDGSFAHIAEHDNVIGHLSPDEVGKWIANVMAGNFQTFTRE